MADATARAQGHPAFQHHVGADLRAGPDVDLGADDAVGTDAHAGLQLGARIHDGRGVDAGGVSHPRVPRARARASPASAPCAPAPEAWLRLPRSVGRAWPAGSGGRRAGTPAPPLPRLHVAGYARLRGEDGPFPDGHVIGDADLAGQDGAIANGAGARDADLGHQDHVLADRAVVAHLYEVVDLASAAD